MDFNTNISKLKIQLHTLAGKIKTSKLSDKEALKNKLLSQTSMIARKALFTIGKYSYEHENILGLEISPHYIRVCQMKNTYGKWSLNQLASSCMESQFVLADIRSNPDIYSENLKMLITKHNIKAREVAVSIPASSSIIKIINIPDMEEDELEQAASMGGIWESLVELNGGIHEYSVYYKILNRKIKSSNSLAEKRTYETDDAPVSSPSEIASIPVVTQEVTALSVNFENLLQGETTPTVTPTYEERVENVTQAEEIQAENNIEAKSSTPQEEASTEETVAEESIQEEENTMDILFVAAKIMDINLYLDIVQKAGLKAVLVDIKYNALKHAFETNPEKNKIPEPYALLEFGPDENYIYIINGAQTLLFNIEISYEDKKLITNNGNDLEAISGVVQRYADKLQEILDDYINKYNHKICNIYVSSATPLHVDNAASEPLINIFISRISQIMGDYKISPCTFCNHIEVPAEFAKKVNAEGNLSAWAAVLGLATYKLDVFDYNKKCAVIDRVNLLPGAELQKKSRALQLLSILGTSTGFAFIIVLSILSFLILTISSSKLSSQIASLETVKKEYDGKNSEMLKLKSVMDKIKSLDSIKNTLPSNQVQVIDVYKNITKSIPEGVWLSEINFQMPKSVEVKGNSINDQNILEFIKNLNESGGFKKVSLKTMETTDKADDKTTTSPSSGTSNVKKFALQCDFIMDAASTKLEIISGGAK